MNHRHLMNELENKHDAKVIHTKENSFPVFTTSVSYYPIQKTPMDILMKMMLIAFQKAPIKATDVLANILLVEPLFIEDLTSKMQQAHLIEIAEGEPYKLTSKGLEQLEAGIFEEQMDLVTEEVYYSAIHETILNGDIDAIFERDDIPEPLEYVEEQIEHIHEANVVEQLQQSISESELLSDEENEAPQAFVNAIESFEIGSIQDIPITIFILKEEGTDRLFARVFNHFTNDWDAILDEYVSENERSSWKKLKGL